MRDVTKSVIPSHSFSASTTSLVSHCAIPRSISMEKRASEPLRDLRCRFKCLYGRYQKVRSNLYGLDRTLIPSRQFYLLSKTHHPDHNRNDPQASERFVIISEAYAILCSPQKRERYDREVQDAKSAYRSNIHRGSHSSSSTPFGSRPPGGLSQRRTQFKGPPPSFYRSGGWGTQGSKRPTQAREPGSAGTGEPIAGEYGPCQGHARFNDVPHFDQKGHRRTQEQQDRRRRRRMEEESVGFVDEGSVLVQFFLVSAVVMLALSIPMVFNTSRDGRKKKDQP